MVVDLCSHYFIFISMRAPFLRYLAVEAELCRKSGPCLKCFDMTFIRDSTGEFLLEHFIEYYLFVFHIPKPISMTTMWQCYLWMFLR